MPLEVDHVFIACAPGAPEADTLLQLGLVEGSPNTHPGQGTANRRFFFANFMLELLWVADAAEATSARTRRTRLWERCSHRGPEVSPFGILFRTTGDDTDSRAPFRTWSYHPSYLPPGLAIEVAEGTTLQEPELFCLPFLRGARSPTPGPTSHSWALGRVQGLSVGVRSRPVLSEASRATEQLGLLAYFESREHVLEIHFQGSFPKRIDLRPVLPMVLSVAP
jgi:hypothetical protein